MGGCVGPADGVHDQAVPDVGRDGVPRVWSCDERNLARESERENSGRELFSTGRGRLQAWACRTAVDLFEARYLLVYLIIIIGNQVWYCHSTKAKATLWSLDRTEGSSCWNML